MATSSASRYEQIFENEKYMQDVVSNHLSNLSERVKSREENSIWGPVKLPAYERSFFRSEQDKICDDVRKADVPKGKQKMENTTERKEKSEISFSKDEMDFTCSSVSIGIQTDIQNEIEQGTKLDDQISQKASEHQNGSLKITMVNDHIQTRQITRNDKKRSMSESENDVEKFLKTEGCMAETQPKQRKSFEDWCNERSALHKEAKPNSPIKQPTNDANKFINNLNVKRNTETNQRLSPEKPSPKIKSDNIPVKDMKAIARKKKRNSSGAAECSTQKAAVKQNDNCSVHKEMSVICIEVIDKNSNKRYELTVDQSDVSRIKKRFPKLSEIMPEVDSGSTEIKYCADAVNVILRYVYNRLYNFDATSSLKLNTEILAASHCWGIDKFHERLLKDFLKILTPSNISKVFPHADHYGLNKVCDACRNLCPDNTDLNSPSDSVNQKTCIVKMSTYVEPLELSLDTSIPFYPLEKTYRVSFNRHIMNKITFKATSGCYIITGIQIQLNEDHLKDKSESNMLEIDYVVKNLSNNQKIDSQILEKPSRSIIIIYFKEDLVLSPNEVGEITIETDLKPYLGFACREKEINIINSKFNITMQSYYKIQGSDDKLFLVKKLFYHVKE